MDTSMNASMNASMNISVDETANLAPNESDILEVHSMLIKITASASVASIYHCG